MIFDRNGTLLIDNHPAFDLEIIPQYLKESKQTDSVLARLAPLIGMPEKEIRQILEKARTQPTFMPVKVKVDLSRDEVAAVESWKIEMPGVQIQQEIKRTNVYGDIASHLLGYIGEVNSSELASLNKNPKLGYKLGDTIGKFGLEQRMEETLRGRDGERLVEVDAMGRLKLGSGRARVQDAFAEVAPQPGKNLHLTIDQDLQITAAQAFGEKAGALVAIEPGTGQILAMISRPSFDPTEFSRGIPTSTWQALLANENRPLRDKTLQDHYPPGSVFKIVTAVAGLEEGVIDSKSQFFCTGSLRVGNRVHHCHLKQGHGEVDVVKALSRSCDVFFYRVAQKLNSVDDIAKWARFLGLGRKTGINLAMENPGLIPTEEWKQKRYGSPWNLGETLSVAIGQGPVLTTILQLANLYASIANGGTLFRPYMIRRVETYEGNLLKDTLPEKMDEHRLKPETYDLIRRGLWGVVNAPGGTALSQRLPGMDFAGKTGTAQVISLSKDKIYGKCMNMRYKERHHGLFAGYAPSHNPKIAVALVAEHACSGSGGAGPIARAVVKKYLEKLDPSKYSPEAIAERMKSEKTSVYKAQATPTVHEAEDSEDVLPDSPPHLPEGTSP
jgi:penicillin-binding protein 2